MASQQSSHLEPPASQPQHLRPQNLFDKTLMQLQNNCSELFQNLSSSFHHHFPQFNPPHLPSLKTHLESAISNFQDKKLLPSFSSSSSSANNPAWARITPPSNTQIKPAKPVNNSMTAEAIEERLAGIPVYALSNSSEEFVLLSGARSKKSLGLFCLRKEDADELLEQMRTMDPEMRKGSKVVPVALNKVLQLKINGVAFRLIPEASQIQHALKTLGNTASPIDAFPGVPVFQSRSLVLRSENVSYRPVFFRKEDLETSLNKASQQQRRLNPAIKPDDIEVGAFEEIVKGMKDTADSKWGDVVFIPPGFDVSTIATHESDTARD